MERIKLDNGHEYELEMIAVRELQKADNGRIAEDIFNRFAPHVPRCHRGVVWFAVDDIR